VDRNFCKFANEPRNAIDVDWRLVDKVVPCSRLEETVWRRAVERAARVHKWDEAAGPSRRAKSMVTFMRRIRRETP
jgi:hypothetical protein